ncbi:hypothetical protein [Chryseobacterium indoltheticum]|uniref:hypothetical protein n=1 Tax=Chryseobacterium indoltheticum TaxID=254 RepID=UPI0019133BCF|nr:hypothetical protein [Chryseobacterium indoltheticum]QQQ26915.1 hypothetical protein JJL46_12370 [Chryseobacterium indoltheticum]
MYNYTPTGVYSAKALADEEREDRKKDKENRIFETERYFSQLTNNIVRENSNIKPARLKEFYDQIIKGEGELLLLNNEIKQIYVKLLNFQVPKKGIDRLKEINGSMQYIRGNDEKQSKLVNMDYFSVRIDKMPTFSYQTADAGMLFKKIRDNFLTLSKGKVTFESNCKSSTINGNWEFLPYPPNYKNELNIWEKQLGFSIFIIKAGGGFKETIGGDHGAVLESEISQNSWIFTTIFTPKSGTQPFSGHRQFGIHQDKDGNYRFFTRAIDRIWPSEMILYLKDKECTIKDYLIIADATWHNLIKNVSQFINDNYGKTTIMPEEKKRIDFNVFFSKFRSQKPVTFVGNVEQFKE